MEKNKTIKRLSSVLFAVLLIAALVLSVVRKRVAGIGKFE